MRHLDRCSFAFAVALAVVTFVAVACSTTPKVTLSGVGNSPAGTFTSGLATVPVGIVLGFAVQTESTTPVTAAVDDPTVATIAPAVQSSQFVVIGLAIGQTTLRIYVNDDEATELPVQVIAAAL